MEREGIALLRELVGLVEPAWVYLVAYDETLPAKWAPRKTDVVRYPYYLHVKGEKTRIGVSERQMQILVDAGVRLGGIRRVVMEN